MTANQWSGLAPAVDSHLERWAIIKRVHDRATGFVHGTNDEMEEQAQQMVLAVARHDAGMRWLVFARSYGLPGPDGIPRGAFEVIDESQPPETGVAIEDGTTISGRELFQDTGQSLATGMLMIQREHAMLDAAVTHYVSEEVVDEVTWAAEESFPEPLFETDLITPAGFAVLEKPIAVVDLHPDTGLPDPRVHIHVRAIGWQRHGGIKSPSDGGIGPGVTLFLYTTPDDYINGYVKQVQAIGRETVDPAGREDVEGPFLPVEVIPWRFGVEWSPRDDDINYHVPGTVPSPVAFQRRWFFAFMRLCWQEIIVRHTTHEPRQAHRRWERFAKRKELLDYTTLRLRRVVDPFYKPTGMGVPLDHRVLVRAHWHRAHCSSLGPARLPDGTMDPATHRLVWIEAYWKGPEDGPIGPMHPATSVTR